MVSAPPQQSRPAQQQHTAAAATNSAAACSRTTNSNWPGEVVPMTPMRKKIAERMVESDAPARTCTRFSKWT